LASPDHRELARSLQGTIVDFRRKLGDEVEEAWRDREEMLKGAEEAGGDGLADVEKGKEVAKPVVAGWKGLGFLA
jgi:hypothetical protein